ncbi:MAG TPA: hypothetical protein VFZ61_30550 [Polyangiales bacterium]
MSLHISMLLAAAAIGATFPTLDPLKLFMVAALTLPSSTVLGRLSSRCFIKSKRVGASGALQVLAADPRPPVVYFRPFDADVATSKSVIYTSWITDEEQLSIAMRDLGPFVAIGRPHDTEPYVGAARLYVDDEHWQQHARVWIEKARLIVLRVGGSAGLHWELETARAIRSPHHLLLLVPNDEAAYEAFRSRVQALMPGLPTLSQWQRRRWFRANLKAVISFEQDGTPRVLDLSSFQVPLLRRNPIAPLAPLLHAGLGRLYAELGVHWARPAVNKHALVLLACAVSLVISTLLIALDQRGVLSRGAPHSATQRAFAEAGK